MKTEKTKTEKKDRPSLSLLKEVTVLRKENIELESKNVELKRIIDYFGVWEKRKVVDV